MGTPTRARLDAAHAAAEVSILIVAKHFNCRKVPFAAFAHLCIKKCCPFEQEQPTSAEDQREATGRIEIPGDVLIPDAEFCRVVLAGATRRTASRLEAEGLPFAMVGGRKSIDH